MCLTSPLLRRFRDCADFVISRLRLNSCPRRRLRVSVVSVIPRRRLAAGPRRRFRVCVGFVISRFRPTFVRVGGLALAPVSLLFVFA